MIDTLIEDDKIYMNIKNRMKDVHKKKAIEIYQSIIFIKKSISKEYRNEIINILMNFSV